MARHISSPRLLPVTILVMLLLLVAKAATFAKDAGAALGVGGASAPMAVPAAVTAPPSASPPVAHAPAAVADPANAASSGETIDPKERALLQDLRKRREALEAREQMLDERKSVLDATELRLHGKLDQMADLQNKLDALDAARKQRQDQNWSGLVKVYETMKPRDAAGIFNVLDMHVLLQVLDRMSERKAAAVMAAMEPERARLATQMLAQMRVRQDLVTPPALADAQATKFAQ